MPASPILERLGLATGERAVILHVDDVGMCEATVSAFDELLDGDLPISGSVMVPCPWFPAAAALCRARPEADVGVHLTLTSEWRSYRWGPLSTRDPASGLIDREGYFPRRREELGARVEVEAAARELAAQVERARDAGIDAGHLDSHMFALLHPRLIDVYAGLAVALGVPALFFRPTPETRRLEVEPAQTPERLERFAALGLPIFDHVAIPPLDRVGDPGTRITVLLDALPPGLSEVIVHPARDTPELRALTPTTWRARVADHRALRDPELGRHLRRAGIRPITYRELARAARKASSEKG